MHRLILVYHEPGKPEGYRIIKDYARSLSRRIEAEVKPVPLKRFLSGEEPASKGDCVAALLIARGGHYYSVKDKAKAYGARFIGKIPLDLVIDGLKRALSNMYCHRVVILYRRAKRYVEEQEEDLEKLMESIVYDLEVPVLCAGCGKVELYQYDCVVSFTLLPSSLIEEKTRGRPEPFRTIPFLLPLLGEGIEKWISSEMHRACR